MKMLALRQLLQTIKQGVEEQPVVIDLSEEGVLLLRDSEILATYEAEVSTVGRENDAARRRVESKMNPTDLTVQELLDQVTAIMPDGEYTIFLCKGV